MKKKKSSDNGKISFKGFFLSLQNWFLEKIHLLIKYLLYNSESKPDRKNVLKDSRALFSKQVSRLIRDNQPKKGEKSSFIFGLSGKWGIGKTRFLEQLAIDLERDGKFIVIEVSPWKYGSENLTFLRSFLTLLNDRSNEIKIEKYKRSVQFLLNFKKKELPENLTKDLLTIKFNKSYFMVILGLGFIWIMYQAFSPDWLVYIINNDLVHFKELLIAFFTLVFLPKLVNFVLFQQQSKAISTLEEFDTVLTDVIDSFPKDYKLVIFVDDLDRVSPDVARNVLDTLRTFFDKPDVSFIVTGDHSVLERHIGSQIISDSSIAEQIEEGRRYLKKVFNVYWPLPTQNNEEFGVFLSELINEKTYLKKSVFNRKKKQLDIFQNWLLKYFDKNFRNVKRFVDIVLFNFEVINSQLSEVDTNTIEQLKDLKRHPLLVIRMLMIQEFAAPLFDDYIRTPSLVGQIEYDISSKKGDILSNQIQKLNNDKLLSPSQEQFLKKFMYEKPGFYNSEEGGNVVRNIEPFLYLAASSDLADLRGLTAEDFASELENNNSELLLTALLNAGPPSLSAITNKLLEHFSEVSQSDIDKFRLHITTLLDVLANIDGKNLAQDFFKDLFTKVDISTLLVHTFPISQRMEVYSKFWAWLDSLSYSTVSDSEHYYSKFSLEHPNQVDVVAEMLKLYEKFGHFSGQSILHWVIWEFSQNRETSIQHLFEIKDKIKSTNLAKLAEIGDQLTTIIATQPDTPIAEKIWEILLTLDQEFLNKMLDKKFSEQINANAINVSSWITDHYDEIENLTGSGEIKEAISELIKMALTDDSTFANLYDNHHRLFNHSKDLIWKEAIKIGNQKVYELSKLIINRPLPDLTPPKNIAELVMGLIYDFGSHKIEEESEAEVLSLLRRSDFWIQVKHPAILAKISPKMRATTKPALQEEAKQIVNSWK